MDWHLRDQVLRSMAFQASWFGDPDAGLAFTESALVRANRLTATECALLHNSRSRDLATLGEVQDPLSAIGTADEEFSHARPRRGRAVSSSPRLATADLWDRRQGRRPGPHPAPRTEVADLRDRIGTVVAAA